MVAEPPMAVPRPAARNVSGNDKWALPCAGDVAKIIVSGSGIRLLGTPYEAHHSSHSRLPVLAARRDPAEPEGNR